MINDIPDRDALLPEILNNVIFDGWTDRALRLAGSAQGLSQGEIGLLFPGGALDALKHMSDWADRQALAAAAEDPESFSGLKVRERIAFLVRRRLEALAPHKEAVRRSPALLVRPDRWGVGPRLGYRTVDRFWRAAGDRSTDFNFYSKRGLLAGVIVATELFWLNDSSDDHEETWEFLDRRIEEVLKVGRRMSGLSRLGDLAEAPFRIAARLRGRRTATSSESDQG